MTHIYEATPLYLWKGFDYDSLAGTRRLSFEVAVRRGDTISVKEKLSYSNWVEITILLSSRKRIATFPSYK